MNHSCQLRGCDMPHDSVEERASANDYEYAQFKKWAEEQDKRLCPHGFNRCPGSPFDCQCCVELEKKRLSRPLCRGVSCDIQVPERDPYCPVHHWVLGKWLAQSREILRKSKEAA